MAQHRIRLEDHLSQPWLVHDLLADLSVEDVWEFPVRLRPGDSLADFRREMTVAVRNMNPLDPAALLFRIRYTIGKLFRGDRVQGTPWRRRLYDRFVAAHPELPATDAVAEVEAATVYETPDEYLGEIENRTVLAGLHLSRISVGDGAYGVRLAVYVKPKGRGGRLYMSLIKPFRLWVVYPAIMTAVASRWRQYVATTSPPDQTVVGWKEEISMEIPKPSEEDKEYFRAIVPEDPRVEVKPMFGNVAAFVNGNMFMGLFGADVGVRLAEPARAELEAMAGARPFGPAGRPMGQYVTMPAAWRDQPDLTATWVQRSLDHVAAMPPKQKKSKQ